MDQLSSQVLKRSYSYVAIQIPIHKDSHLESVKKEAQKKKEQIDQQRINLKSLGLYVNFALHFEMKLIQFR